MIMDPGKTRNRALPCFPKTTITSTSLPLKASAKPREERETIGAYVSFVFVVHENKVCATMTNTKRNKY